MTQNYELIVKGTRNFENKVTVILTLQDKEHFAGEIFDLNINLERQGGAALEFYEEEAIKQAKALFRDVAAKLCEGRALHEKHPCFEPRYTIKINSLDNTILSVKDDIESRIEQLECYISELKKSTPTKDEVLALDEMKETILDRAVRLSCASRLKEHFQQP
ncbi:DUF1327 domain-containing protein [Escherichia coli]|uniref:DUF1327 domain-containing protein n=1 Tax=Escherichia coli TaxID=562 RepID=UPI000DA5E303|nr:DUF1327 domain-containing protein [Escherichia coli]SQQ49117.1 bacteriophage protein [Escherichia coli]